MDGGERNVRMGSSLVYGVQSGEAGPGQVRAWQQDRVCCGRPVNKARRDAVSAILTRGGSAACDFLLLLLDSRYYY